MTSRNVNKKWRRKTGYYRDNWAIDNLFHGWEERFVVGIENDVDDDVGGAYCALPKCHGLSLCRQVSSQSLIFYRYTCRCWIPPNVNGHTRAITYRLLIIVSLALIVPRVFLESIRRLSLHTLSSFLIGFCPLCVFVFFFLSLVCLLLRRRRLNLSTTRSTVSPSIRSTPICLVLDLAKQTKIPVACSTTTVTKCQAGLRTLQTFPVFHPTCLCREPSVDPDCNAFRDSLFDHPCMVATQKGKLSSYYWHYSLNYLKISAKIKWNTLRVELDGWWYHLSIWRNGDGGDHLFPCYVQCPSIKKKSEITIGKNNV